MSRNGSGIYSKPAGTTAIANTTIESAKYNSTVDDLVADANLARPIVAGGTGATTAAQARLNLGIVADGTAALPGGAFALDLDTGPWRPAANIMAWSTAGLEAFRVNATQSLLIGSPNSTTGIGAGRINSQGITAATSDWNLTRHSATSSAPVLAFGKTRGTAVDTYTIVAAADSLGQVEFWGADGTTMVRGAAITSYCIGTPAAGDIRGGLRLWTGSGAGSAVAIRLGIDDTTIAATLPITTTGSVLSLGSGGIGYGPGGGGAVVQATSKANGVTLNAAGGKITTHAAALGAGISVEFTLTSSEIGIEDHVGVTIQSPASKYTATVVGKTAGTCIIRLTNYTAGGLSEAVLINFAVVKVSVT